MRKRSGFHWKQVISALLALAMVVGICPNYSERAQANTASQMIDFSSPNINEAFAGKTPGKNEYDVRSITYADTGEDWQWWETNHSKPAATSFYLYKGNYFRVQIPTIGQWVALEIRLKNSGTQTFGMKTRIYRAGGTANMFLFKQTEAGLSKDEIAQKLSEETAIGILNCYDADAAKVAETNANLGTVQAEVGTYLLVFQMTKGGYLFLDETTIESFQAEDAIFDHVEFTADQTSLRAGTTARASVKAISVSNKEMSLQDASVEFSTLTPDYVDIDANTGAINAKKAGNAQIKVRVTIKEVMKEAICNIEVLPAGLKSLKLEYEKQSLILGEELLAKLTGILTTGEEVDLTTSAAYTSSAQDVVAIDSRTGSVRGVANGSAQIVASVTYEGEVHTARVNLYVYDESAIREGVRVAHNLMIRDTSWVATTPGNNANDIRGIDASYTDGWALHSWGGGINPAMTTFYQYNNSYLRTDMRVVGGWVAIQFQIPAPGVYRSVFEFVDYKSGGAADVYLVPEDLGDVESNLTDERKIGHLQCNTPDKTELTSKFERLNDVEITTPGSYLMVFRMTDISKGAYLMLKQAVFSNANPVTSLSTSAIKAMNVGETTQLEVGVDYEAPLQEYKDDIRFSYESLTPEVLSVTPEGSITSLKNGIGVVRVSVSCFEKTLVEECTITVGSVKTRRSFYTDKKIANAQNNIERYSWARSMKENAVKKADQLIGQEEKLWNIVTTQELPRASTVGYRTDAGQHICVYCGCDLRAKYGTYPWIVDPMSTEWKIQCPDCRRMFPSNDFGGFYELGLDEQGNYNYEKAKAENQKLVDAGQDGYLKNALYPEKGEGWGVDDGWGFKIDDECKPFIGYYNYNGVWHKTVRYGLSDLMDAYLYTGDAKYGRLGAILLDRVADVYPEMDVREYGAKFLVADGNSKPISLGRITGKISDYNLALVFARAYDAFFPAMSDPKSIEFLSQKSKQYQMENPKTSGDAIVVNVENNLIREINSSIRDYRISSNFGHHQMVHLTAAVALDNEVESKEWIDFSLASHPPVEGKTGSGDIYMTLVNKVDRDGFGNEAAAAYNVGWLSSMMELANILSGYDKYPDADLYQNPKFIKMMDSIINTICVSQFIPNIGDNSIMGKGYTAYPLSVLLKIYEITGNENIARLAYLTNNESTEGLYGDIFSEEPEKIVADIKRIIQEDEALSLGSINLAGYGMAILRDGQWLKSAIADRTLNTQRDFYIYYGRTGGHGHPDKLTLGVHAYGLDLAADTGTPEIKTNTDPHRLQFIEQTLSHNTVTVDEKPQTLFNYGDPLHFDDAGEVKVMDISAPQCYASTSEYRRTLIMIDANDNVSYGVDVFHVKGGSDHNYSFHALSQEAAVEGVTLVGQKDEAGQYIGSYAGADVPWGEKQAGATHPDAYSWFGEVETAKTPGTGSFSVDWKIKDYYSVLNPAKDDLHLRLTMLNSFDLDEVTLTSGIPPQVPGAPESIKYMFARRQGSGLDSLFTSIIEPYDTERYIEKIESADVSRTDGKDLTIDEVKAVKVTLTNGREDYIVYAKDNTVQYEVDQRFAFAGFVGVISVEGGEIVSSYLNDGTTIGEHQNLLPAITGEVVTFTKEMSVNNYIDVQMDQAVDAEALAGKYIYINNTGADNACYRIENAMENGENIRLHLGNITLISSYKDSLDLEKGYVYNIDVGNKFRIPLSMFDNPRPTFDSPLDTMKQVEAGSEITFQVHAVSPIESDLTYSANVLPRGANFDPETQKFTWIPDSAQLGKNIVKFTVSDGARTETLTCSIMVYNSASGGGDKPIDNPSQGTGNNGNNNQGEVDPPVVTVEEDEVKFAASTEETTADTKLGSVTFPDGTFAEDGQGTLNIKKENEKFNISVSATVDMEKKPAKVSLNYTPADNMTDKNCIVVKDAKGNIIPNGKYADGKMVFYTDTFGDFTIAYNPKSFTDLGNHAWASEAIIRLAARGIINGITATTYGPARNITRADFTTLIVRAFGFEGEVASFADVPANAYYAEPVGIAKTLGIVGGVNETDFAPTAEITRQDMMVIVARALDKAGYVLHASESPEFSDTAEVADYAKDAMQMLTASGIIAGAGGKINPKGKTTRAEVAVILDRILFMVS